jgi:hypothetical protein
MSAIGHIPMSSSSWATTSVADINCYGGLAPSTTCSISAGHTIKERNAQLSMAETALELTKAKVAATVKTSYFELDRSRHVSELAHRLSAAIPLERVSHSKNDPEFAASRAKGEAEMLQADLDYRQALTQLRTLMGEE